METTRDLSRKLKLNMGWPLIMTACLFVVNIGIYFVDLQAGVISLRQRGEDCEKTALRLAQAGIAVRSGLHCAPLAHQSAGTLSSGTVRISLSCFNTAQEIRRLEEFFSTDGFMK